MRSLFLVGGRQLTLMLLLVVSLLSSSSNLSTCRANQLQGLQTLTKANDGSDTAHRVFATSETLTQAVEACCR